MTKTQAQKEHVNCSASFSEGKEVIMQQLLKAGRLVLTYYDHVQ